MRQRLNFDEIKEKVSFQQVAQQLNTQLKRDGVGFRCACSVGRGDDRAIKITVGKGFFCHSCHEGGNDVIGFYAHLTGMGMYDSAADIAKHFGIGSASDPASPKPPPRGESKGMDALDHLDPTHWSAGLLGLSEGVCKALGAGFAKKGLMSGRMLLPLRLPTGELVGYFGIATKEDQSPVLKFPDNLDERCGIVAPVVEEPGEDKPSSKEEMRKRLRVV